MCGPSHDHELVAGLGRVHLAVDLKLQAIVEDVPEFVAAGVPLETQNAAGVNGDDLHGAWLVEREAAPRAPRARIVEDVCEVIHGYGA